MRSKDRFFRPDPDRQFEAWIYFEPPQERFEIGFWCEEDLVDHLAVKILEFDSIEPACFSLFDSDKSTRPP